MYEITTSLKNKDIPFIDNNYHKSKDYYLKQYGDFISSLPDPVFHPSKERSDINILNFAMAPCGLKAYGAEKLIATLDNDTVAYAAPRVGHAAEAIAYLCEKYNKRAVFFAPASKEVSAHQSVVTAYKTSELRFVKIPAMPTLNTWIKNWCKEFGAKYLPFGLSDCIDVTAGLVKVASEHAFMYGEPKQFYCAVSTGTMIRAFEIGWPHSNGFGVAVARNIKDGEIGKCTVKSYHKRFYDKSDYMPDFNTTETYDAKAYKMFIDNALPGSLFINVGSDAQIEHRLKQIPNWKDIKSQREWKDMEAFSYA